MVDEEANQRTVEEFMEIFMKKPLYKSIMDTVNKIINKTLD